MSRKKWVVSGAAGLVILIILGGFVIASGGGEDSSDGQSTSTSTAKVEQGELSAMVTLDGTLAYGGRADGSPYSVINQAEGTYTGLPGTGEKIGCGDVLYRVDDEPVLLLCGSIPAYRDLTFGLTGKDVRQLNRNLHRLGFDAEAGVDLGPEADEFTWETQEALAQLEDEKGLEGTGSLTLDETVFQPRSVRISTVTGKLGGPAKPGAQVALATSDTLEVRVNLDASQQNEVKKGAQARITLPGNRSITGKVRRLGRIARSTPGQNDDVGSATVPAFIGLDEPARASGLDAAPVRVEVKTAGVKNALSVPAAALVGKSGGGFAVEVLRDSGERDLVAVKLGLFDTANGRIQVEGELAPGDEVVVPSL